MKNLLIYISNNETSPYFERDCGELVKVQIENSYRLGWEAKDIWLVTNFPYECMGIKAIVADCDTCSWCAAANKISAIEYLFDYDMIYEDMFFHDFDAFQVTPFTERPEDTKGCDLALPDYGHRDHYNTGIMFFGPGAYEIFGSVSERMFNNRCKTEEVALMEVHKESDYGNRIKMLDMRYNIGKHKTEWKFTTCIQPPMIVHFHPYYDNKTFDFYCGNNSLKTPLIDKELRELIKKYAP